MGAACVGGSSALSSAVALAMVLHKVCPSCCQAPPLTLLIVSLPDICLPTFVWKWGKARQRTKPIAHCIPAERPCSLTLLVEQHLHEVNTDYTPKWVSCVLCTGAGGVWFSDVPGSGAVDTPAHTPRACAVCGRVPDRGRGDVRAAGGRAGAVLARRYRAVCALLRRHVPVRQLHPYPGATPALCNLARARYFLTALLTLVLVFCEVLILSKSVFLPFLSVSASLEQLLHAVSGLCTPSTHACPL